MYKVKGQLKLTLALAKYMDEHFSSEAVNKAYSDAGWFGNHAHRIPTHKVEDQSQFYMYQSSNI